MDGKKKLEKLVAGLDGVTPGPWQLVGWKPCGIYGKGGLADAPRIARIDDRAEHDRDAAHIARCDPDTIRSISDAYKAMEAEVERAAEVIGHLLRCEYDGAGLCDCVDSAGKHYPSQYLADWIKAAEEWASARNALSATGER